MTKKKLWKYIKPASVFITVLQDFLFNKIMVDFLMFTA